MIFHCIMNVVKIFLKLYRGVFNEMWTIDGIVLKGNQAVLPVSLRANAIGLAREGHTSVQIKRFSYFGKHVGFLEWGNKFKILWHLAFPAMQPSHIHTLFPCNPISCLIGLGRRYMLTLRGPLGENTTCMLLLTNIINFLRLTWYPQQALRN